MIKGVPALPRIKGIPNIRKAKAAEPPPTAKIKSYASDLEPRMKRAFYSLCGDMDRRKELIERFMRQLETNDRMTLPESIFYSLLEDRGVEFSYQSSFDGGRSELGGEVVDFVVDMGGYALAVLVNGDYWHSTPDQIRRDQESIESVTGQYFNGLQITATLIIWESTLLGCNRERAVDLLLTGVEVGKNY